MAPRDGKATKAQCTFERMVTKYELMVMRNWKDNENYCAWKNGPADTEARIKLYLHKLFALQCWRVEEDNEEFRVPKFTKESKNNYKGHMAFAKTALEEGRKKVEALRACDEKNEMLKGLEWSESWYKYVREEIKESVV